MVDASTPTLNDSHSHGGMLDREALASLTMEAEAVASESRGNRKVAPAAVAKRIGVLNCVIKAWPVPADAADGRAERFVGNRLALIGRKLTRAGLGPGDPPDRLPQLAEQDVLSHETLFQLRATVQETRQRWPAYADSGQWPAEIIGAWLGEVAELLKGPGA